MSKPIAVAFSDLHLSLQAPACRADEDWLAVQANYLKQVRTTAEELGDVPILFAGDLFDRWNPTPELIHFALQHLPDGMLCVPGQHDLPQHRLDEMHRSGYGVLRRAQKIRDASNKAIEPYMFKNSMLVVYGFGWDQDLAPPSKDWNTDHPIGKQYIKIALIHRYFWTADKKYPGAPEECNVAGYTKKLKGYDLALTGDNHLSFIAKAGDCLVVNCGGTIRRKSDELDRKPMMAVVYDDGSVKRKLFDTSADRFHENTKEREETTLDLQSFIRSLEGLGEHGLNFEEAVKNHLRTDDISQETKEIILKALQYERHE